MSGIAFSINKSTNELMAEIMPDQFVGECTGESISSLIEGTEFRECTLSTSLIKKLYLILEDARINNNDSLIVAPIGRSTENVIASELNLDISEDQMSVTMTVVSNEAGVQASYPEVKTQLAAKGVTRGISKKRIQHLLNSALEAKDIDQTFTDVIAIGLPPRKGKPSRIKPLVPNSIDRILRPQEIEGDKVDMRDLGALLCVKPNEAIAKRVSPGNGRTGYTVTNQALPAESGEVFSIILGENTRIDENDENLILSDLAGLPKFENNIMSVDDTYTIDGVNVKTGNIEYEGAVIVNGDVTENMRVIAKGDVTVNGFVESAYIQAGGDIIITEGATGKMHEEDCRLVAKGNIFIQHGQGLDVKTGKDLTVKRQLAYSNVKCKGQLCVGDPDNPTGNLFATKIRAYSTVKAGSIGAVSGSTVEIDFSDGYNKLIRRFEIVSEMLSDLASKNADHEIRLSKMRAKRFPTPLKDKLGTLDSTIGIERSYIKWLRDAQQQLELAKTKYEANARVIANKELFPGVVVSLNKQMYKVEKETLKSRILLVENNWEYQPII